MKGDHYAFERQHTNLPTVTNSASEQVQYCLRCGGAMYLYQWGQKYSKRNKRDK